MLQIITMIVCRCSLRVVHSCDLLASMVVVQVNCFGHVAFTYTMSMSTLQSGAVPVSQCLLQLESLPPHLQWDRVGLGGASQPTGTAIFMCVIEARTAFTYTSLYWFTE